jgi:photosystem II stability/assembly factor-like uncharacterized protein
LLALWPSAGWAHDASGWGGLFRSRDAGATWFQANQGRPVGGALAIAADPGNPNHLLLGTDDGVFVTRNGGQDWEATSSAPRGPVFAVAVDHGGRLLAAGERGVVKSGDGSTWQALPPPSGLTLVRSLVRGHLPGQVYALGAGGLMRSDNFGETWTAPGIGLPRGEVTNLLITPAVLLCVVDGQLWATDEKAKIWHSRSDGLPAGRIQALSEDTSGALWAAAGDRLYTTLTAKPDGPWRSAGNPLPEQSTDIRGIARSPDGGRLLVSTHRGLYASTDEGITWSAIGDNLPGHLEAGPLVADPVEPTTLYVGFALTPYDEQWRRSLEGGAGPAHLTPVDLAGAAAFLVLLGLGAGVALRWLARRGSARLAEPAA